MPTFVLAALASVWFISAVFVVRSAAREAAARKARHLARTDARLWADAVCRRISAEQDQALWPVGEGSE